MNSKPRRRLVALCIAGLLAAPDAFAGDATALPSLSLHGFGTFGLAASGTDGAEFRRDYLQPDGVGGGLSGNIDSRFGLQLNAVITEEFESVVQAVSRYNHNGNYMPELTWAFLSYSPDPALEIRGGRLGWDVYLLADSRDVGFSYLWVRPPVDYFGTLFLTHIDGGDVVYKHQLAGGLFSAKVYGGFIDEEAPSENGPDFDLSGSSVAGVNLNYRQGDWMFRAGYTHARIDKEFPSFQPLLDALRATGIPAAVDIADDLSFENKTLDIFSAGGAWDHGPWQAQLMYNHFTAESLSIPTADSGYFLLGYRRGNWSPFITLSGTASRDNERRTGLPVPNPLDAAVESTLQLSQTTQYTFSAGVRYDFMPGADLKLQLDRVNVVDHEAALWRNVTPGWDGDAMIFSLTLDFAF